VDLNAIEVEARLQNFARPILKTTSMFMKNSGNPFTTSPFQSIKLSLKLNEKQQKS
jgi:hypothetical protein